MLVLLFVLGEGRWENIQEKQKLESTVRSKEAKSQSVRVAMHKPLVVNSPTTASIVKSSSMAMPISSNRQSTMVQYGQGLMDASKAATAKKVSGKQQIINVDSSDALRQSNASGQKNSMNQKQRYSYHPSKPAEQTEKVGQYVTKEARQNQAAQVKASHFQLGYAAADQKLSGRQLDADAERQKWNPQQPHAKGISGKSNWSLGNSAFEGLSQNRNDFQSYNGAFDSKAKERRLELVNQLRKSNLPQQNFEMPKTTAQESFINQNANEKEMAAMKLRKEEANKIFERNRNTKPNFHMGSHKLDYMSENKGSMREPGQAIIDKEGIEQHKANQRMHNFKMSFEQGNQFETDKGTNKPFRMPIASAQDNRGKITKGASNLHQVNISHSKEKNDYKSLTALQQSGYKSSVGTSRNATQSYTENRSNIAKQTADLRSSHFNLGAHNAPAKANSQVMYQAPPIAALKVSTGEHREQRNRMQKNHFTLQDGYTRAPMSTQSQSNNSIRQNQWDLGQIQKNKIVGKPADSINFGQECQYTSESKSTFLGKNGNQAPQMDPKRLKEKFMKNNINFGNPIASQDRMLTVSQATDQTMHQQLAKQPGNMKRDNNTKSREFGANMRSANFKMGSILPEHNSFRAPQLERKGSGASIGLASNQGGFKPQVQRVTPIKTQAVSAGNNIAKGSGSFKTVNQEFTNWIQPSAIGQ